PVGRPIRTRIGPPTRARWQSAAAATALDARAKTTKHASPCVSTSTPSCSANGETNTRRGAPALGERRAEAPPMLLQGLPVVIAQLVQQPRRTLHIREQQSHHTGRE